MEKPTLVQWEKTGHRYARWNENVYCPTCGHRGQWELSWEYAKLKVGAEPWRPSNRYCPAV